MAVPENLWAEMWKQNCFFKFMSYNITISNRGNNCEKKGIFVINDNWILFYYIAFL